VPVAQYPRPKESRMFSYQCECEYECELLATLVVSAPSTSAPIL